MRIKQEVSISLTLIPCAEDLITYGGNEDAHQGTDDIEKTIGQIGEGGNPENGALRHATRVPRDEYGGDGHTILCGTTQEATFKTLTIVNLLKHIACKKEAEILVSHG